MIFFFVLVFGLIVILFVFRFWGRGFGASRRSFGSSRRNFHGYSHGGIHDHRIHDSDDTFNNFAATSFFNDLNEEPNYRRVTQENQSASVYVYENQGVNFSDYGGHGDASPPADSWGGGSSYDSGSSCDSGSSYDSGSSASYDSGSSSSDSGSSSSSSCD